MSKTFLRWSLEALMFLMLAYLAVWPVILCFMLWSFWPLTGYSIYLLAAALVVSDG